MIGLANKIVTVQQLYNYALEHNLLGADCTIVLDIINRERNPIVVKVINSSKVNSKNDSCVFQESNVSPANNTSTIDFSKIMHYTVEDLLNLLS